MAIIKPFETPQGVSATYHKILKAEILTASATIEITIAVYASHEARATGKSVLWHEYQRIPFEVLTRDPRDLLYPLLAAFGDSYLFGGAADVAEPPVTEGTAMTLMPATTLSAQPFNQT
jgi:hypothetical protein